MRIACERLSNKTKAEHNFLSFLLMLISMVRKVTGRLMIVYILQANYGEATGRLGMFDSDSIPEKIDSFLVEESVFWIDSLLFNFHYINRFFTVRIGTGMDEPFSDSEFWNWWPFFFRNPVFYKNCMKILFEISGNFSNNFFNGFFKKPYENIVGFSYLVITKIITIFEN